MLDDRGEEIDLEIVDAVGQLPDGRYDVWLKDERRVITGDPTAFEAWIEHVRSKRSDEVLLTRPFD
jgi:hypothetical protein